MRHRSKYVCFSRLPNDWITNVVKWIRTRKRWSSQGWLFLNIRTIIDQAFHSNMAWSETYLNIVCENRAQFNTLYQLSRFTPWVPNCLLIKICKFQRFYLDTRMRGSSLGGPGGTPQVGAMVTIADALDTDLTHPDFEHPNLLVDDVLYFSILFVNFFLWIYQYIRQAYSYVFLSTFSLVKSCVRENIW